jgi:O-antigen/teichoic acid export membrane protein
MVASLAISRFAILLGHVAAADRLLPMRVVWQAERANAEDKGFLIRFGAWMTASNIISPLMVSIDRFVIASMLGATVVAFYTVPFDFIFRLLIIPAALTGALFPRFSFMFAQQDPKFHALYRRSLRIILLGMGLISASVAAGSFLGLTLWLGRTFAEKSWLVASILSLGLLANSLAQVPFAAVQATGGVKIISIIHVAEACVYFPMLYFSVGQFGLVGAAWMFVFRVTADLAILEYVARRRMPE